jgi:hypothetical protein
LKGKREGDGLFKQATAIDTCVSQWSCDVCNIMLKNKRMALDLHGGYLSPHRHVFTENLNDKKFCHDFLN